MASKSYLQDNLCKKQEQNSVFCVKMSTKPRAEATDKRKKKNKIVQLIAEATDRGKKKKILHYCS